MEINNFNKIKIQAPNAWKEFEKYCKSTYADFFISHPTIYIEEIPFSMLIGVYQEYFIENTGPELDLGNLSYDQLENEVVEAFIVQEGIMRHFS